MATTTAFRSPLLSRFAFKRPVTFTRRILQKRAQSTTAAATADSSAAGGQSKLAQLWNSEVGPKTVHFWAPIMKWGVVLTGVSDFARPAETLSLAQNLSLMATGAIWTRWCFIIKPRNLFLASVNALLFCVGATQVGRIFTHNKDKNNRTAAEEALKLAEAAKDSAKDTLQDPMAAVKGK